MPQKCVGGSHWGSIARSPDPLAGFGGRKGKGGDRRGMVGSGGKW